MATNAQDDYQGRKKAEMDAAEVADARSQQGPEAVLRDNQSVPFVDRMLRPDKYPVRTNEDGTISTHLLATAGGGPDEPVFVYPTLQLIDGQWVSDDDPENARGRGNVVYFDSLSSAEQFARGSWKHTGEGTAGVGPESRPY